MEVDGAAICAAAASGDIAAIRTAMAEPGGASSREAAHAVATATDSAGYTPLHWAALHNHPPLLSLLLDSDADVAAAGPGGTTPLHWAAQSGHVRVAAQLLSRSPDPAQLLQGRDANGYLAIHYAAQVLIALLSLSLSLSVSVSLELLDTCWWCWYC
jgi:ankyrin repeat protein